MARLTQRAVGSRLRMTALPPVLGAAKHLITEQRFSNTLGVEQLRDTARAGLFRRR